MFSAEQDKTEHERQLDAIIAEYYRLPDADRSSDQNAFILRHPNFASDLKEFFSDARLLYIEDSSSLPTASLGQTVFDMSQQVKPAGGLVVRHFGEYEILEKLGTGGMGIVYKARQKKLNRLVALKMIRSGALANASDVQRFEAEAKATAKLSHSGIVSVHEVGIHDGHHFYTMDCVDGGNLSERHRDKPVPAKYAAMLVSRLAEAMHYAHLQGIVHRDLKPANILLTPSGEPKITDFGLAKRVCVDDESQTATMTESGQILGTAGYMSPEQASGKSRLVGPSTDIYSLGAVLYALLTSRAPFVGETPYHTIIQLLQNEPISPRKINPNVPRDLETICLKCLEKEPHKRYGTAQLLADDLGQFLKGKPVTARPVSKVTKAWSWARRNPWIAATLFLIVLSGLGGFYSAFEQARLRAIADQNLAGSETALKVSQWNVYKARLFPMLAAYREKDFGQLEQLLEESKPQENELDFRGWEWYFFEDQVQRRSRKLLPGEGPWNYVQYSHDGKFFAARRWDRNIDIIDRDSLQIIQRIPGDTQNYFAWHPKRALLAIPQGRNNVHIWDIAQHRRTVTFQIEDDSGAMERRGIAWSPDGTQIAVGGMGEIDLFYASGQHLKKLKSLPMEANQLDWHPNGKLLAVAGISWLAVLDIDSNTEVWKKFRSRIEVMDIEWNSAGTWLGSAWHWPDNQIKVHSVEGIEQSFSRLPGAPWSLAWSGDGNSILSVGQDQQTHFWNVDTGTIERTLNIHGSAIVAVDWDTATETAVSVDLTGNLRVFQSSTISDATAQFKVPLDAPGISWAEWCPTDLDLYAFGAANDIFICRASGSKVIQTLSTSTAFTWFSWHPSGKRLVTLDQAGTVVEWDPFTATQIRRLQASTFDYGVSVGWSPDGKYLATTAGQQRKKNSLGSVDIFSAASGELLFQLDVYRPRVHGDWSPDSRFYAMHSHTNGSTVRIVDVQEKRLVAESASLTGGMRRLAFSPDGTRIAAGGFGGALTILDAASAKVLQSTQVRSSEILGLQWSTSGRRLMCSTVDDALTILDGPTGDKLITFTKQDGLGGCGMWSPDGGRIVTVSAEGDVKQWGSLRADYNKSKMTVDPATAETKQQHDSSLGTPSPESPSIASSIRIEGETLYVRSFDAGEVVQQDMASFGGAKWSGGWQLLWVDAKPKSRLTLEFDLNVAGDYEVDAVLTTAPDFAIVDLFLDGVSIDRAIDLYRRDVVGTTGRLDFGTYALKAGKQQLVIEIKSANAASIGRYGFGIDYLELNLMKTGQADDKKQTN